MDRSMSLVFGTAAVVIVAFGSCSDASQAPSCTGVTCERNEFGSTDDVSLLQTQILSDTQANASNENCEWWCARREERGDNSWDQLCTWKKCSGCDDCGPTTTTSTTTSASTSQSETTGSSPHETWQSPYYMMKCDGTQILTTAHMTRADYDSATEAVQDLYNKLPSTCSARDCPQADWAGCILRVAGHDFMDYKAGEGGSDACIDLHDIDNTGLAECIYEGEFGISLADAYADFCTTISLADFFVIAAEAIMQVSRGHVLKDDPSRTSIDFASRFKYGRTTARSCAWAEGRLPNPEESCTAVERTFVQNMGLSWAESAALMGVHTLGRAQISKSGYDGWWSDFENSRRFNNNYFTSIVLKGWGPETGVNGNPGKNQWKRIDSGTDEETLGKEMMLNTDMCLYFTSDDAGSVELNAKTAEEEDCLCTWTIPVKFQKAADKYNNGKFCGTTDNPGSSDFPRQRAICCGAEFSSARDKVIDCGLVVRPRGFANEAIKSFAINEDTWIQSFYLAWGIATTNGFPALKSL